MIKLYHVARSRSVRVRWLLEELGIPYEVKTLEFTPAVLKGEEYRQVHPLGKVPSIQDGELTMYESGAIVEYLVETYGKGRLAPPVGTAPRGLFLQWIHFAEATAMPPLSDIVQHSFLRPEAERIAAVVPDAHNRARAVLEVIDQALAGKSYVLGDEFTAADVMVGYALLLMRWVGVLGDGTPNATAYLNRLQQRPALQKALS
jgi:glutathione S-transferase